MSTRRRESQARSRARNARTRTARPAERLAAHKAKTVRSVSRRLQRLIAADRAPIAPAPTDPVEAAQIARLRYVSDEDPGIRRAKAGAGFRYEAPGGRTVKDAATLSRIKALAIPPAWTNVWICPDPVGHIQATGRDARGRKQYRYHGRWREVRDRAKFGRMIDFAETLPRIRKAVDADLALPGLSRRKVLAAVVRLLEETNIRVGSDEYARDNHHYGLTTLQDRHLAVSGPELRFRFKGKSGKDHLVGFKDARLARIVRNCQEIPGQRLFQYFDDDDGEPRAIDSGDVNDYLREISGSDFTAKDFRTWAGTTLVAAALLACEEPKTAKAAKQHLIAAVDAAAERLGNTRAVCRASYVHPAVMDAFNEGWIKNPPRIGALRPVRGLDDVESATLRLLRVAAEPKAHASRAA